MKQKGGMSIDSIAKYAQTYKQYVPKFWVEYLHRKVKRVEAPPGVKHKIMIEILEAARAGKKAPVTSKVGDYPGDFKSTVAESGPPYEFAKFVLVKDLQIPIGFRGSAKNLHVVVREYRFAVLSNGEIVGNYVDAEARREGGEVPAISYDLIDRAFTVCKVEDGRYICWHGKFLEKVMKAFATGEIKPWEIDLLMGQNRYGGDNPIKLVKQGWLNEVMKKLAMHCKITDTEDRWDKIEIANFDWTIGKILEIPGTYTGGRYQMMQYHQNELNLFHVAIDRFAEWAEYKGIKLEMLLEMTVRELCQEFILDVENKADALRDEVLERYGFQDVSSCKDEKILNTALETPTWYMDTDSQLGPRPRGHIEGWIRTNGSSGTDGTTVLITHDSQVYINGRYICIINDRDDHLPLGDKIVQRVFALGTDLRNDIYTLDKYRSELEEMFKQKGGETGNGYEKGKSPSWH